MATPKSTKERIHRHMRMAKVTPHSHDHVGKVVPKKTGNNDPHRSGNPILHNEEHKEFRDAVIFLAENVGKPEAQMKELIAKFPQKDSIRQILNHMIAVRMGGWRLNGDTFVNESGRTASPNNWILEENGRLVCKNKQPVLFDIDWLYDLVESCG